MKINLNFDKKRTFCCKSFDITQKIRTKSEIFEKKWNFGKILFLKVCEKNLKFGKNSWKNYVEDFGKKIFVGKFMWENFLSKIKVL